MKSKKTMFKIGMLLILALCSLLVLSACTQTDDGECVHTWGEWATVKEATCTEDGSAERVCSACGHKESQSVPATGVHSFGEWATVTAATCTENGSAERVCSACGDKESKVLSSAGAHTYGEWMTVQAAGCTVAGSEKQVCSGCGDEAFRAISAAHKPGEPATCTTNQICTECQTVLVQGAHDYTDAVTQPTCIATGYTTHTCSKCGDTYQDSQTATVPHTPNVEAATCLTKQFCTVCTETLEQQKDHVYEIDVQKSTPASCTEAGIDVHACTTPGCTASYNTKGADATGHNYQQKASTQRSCTDDETVTYHCDRCGDEYTETVSSKTGHDYSACTPVEGSEALVSGCTYEYTYRGLCSHCNQTVERKERAEKHTYAATITKEATCQDKGTKTYKCTVDGCTASYTEDIPASHAHHVFDAGTVEGNKITYKCLHCGVTETKINAKDDTNTTVDSETLKETGAVDLKDASITLDDGVKGTLTGDVKIEAAQVKTEDLPELSEEELAAIGNNKIYNFGLTVNNVEKTELGGKVTISIPYTLGENEDPDMIAVWYIDSKGKVTSIQATYSNGFATFETDHFSYYTVTRLTPAERCALYGHSWMPDHVVAATCTSDGYTLRVCFRCGHTEKADVKPATGHSAPVVDAALSKPATCTANGLTVSKCEHEGCDYRKIEVIRATGHSMALDAAASQKATCDEFGRTVYSCEHEGCKYQTQTVTPELGHRWKVGTTVNATCQAAGYVEYTCEREGCGESYRTVLPQTTHTYSQIVMPPSCTEGGYTTNTCTGCNDSYTGDVVAALGHSYTDTVVAPTCTEGGYTLHECGRCDYSYTDAETPAAHKYEETVVAPTCTENGYTLHKCSVCGDEYKTDTVPAAHKFDIAEPTCSRGQVCTVCGAAGKPATGEHTRNDKGVCTVCGAGCEHTYTDNVVAPTCTATGYTEHTCSICQHSYRDTETAVIAHNYVNGTCSMCGKVQQSSGFYLTMLESLADGSWTINLSDLTVTAKSQDGGLSSNIVCYIDQAELMVGRDGNGDVTAYLNGKVTLTPVGFPKLVQSYGIRAALEGGDVSMILEQRGSGRYRSYSSDVNIGNTGSSGTLGSIAGNDSYGSVILPGIGISTRDYVFTDGPTNTMYVYMPIEEMFSSVYGGNEASSEVTDWMMTDLMPILEQLWNENTDLVEEALALVFDQFFAVTDEASGKVLTLDADKVNAFVKVVSEGTISEIADHILGEGGYDKLRSLVGDVLQMTLAELLDAAKAHGLDVDALLAALDRLAVIMTDGEAETIEAYLAQLSNGQIDIDIEAYLADAEFMSQTLCELLAPLADASAVSFPGMIEMMLREYGKMTIMELIGEEPDLDAVAQAQRIIASIAGGTTLTVKTDASGAVREAALTVNSSFDIDATESATISIQMTATPGCNPAPAYAEMIQTVASYVDTLKENLTVSKVSSNKFVFDANGNLIRFDDIEREVEIGNTAVINGQTVRVEYVTERGYIYYLSNGTGCVTFSTLCGSWLEMNIMSTSYEYVNREYIAIYDLSGNLLSKEVQYDRGYTSSGMTGFSVAMNKDTGEISDDVDAHGHEFEVDASKTVTNTACGGISEIHSICKNCQETSVEYTVKGHAISESNDMEEGKTCEDGITVKGHCAICDIDVYTYTINEHHYQSMGTSNGCHSISFSCCEYCGDCKYFELGDSHRWDYVYDSESDTESYVCMGCGAIYSIQTVEKALDNCQVELQTVHTLMQNGKVAYTFTETVIEDAHTAKELIDSYELLNPEVGCEAGFIMTLTCPDCNRVASEQFGFDHYPVTEEEFDLSSYTGVCSDHKVTLYVCACGKVTGEIEANFGGLIAGNDDDCDGIDDGEKNTCTTCGLCFEQIYSTSTEGCVTTETRYYKLSLNGTVLAQSAPEIQERNSHQYAVTVGASADGKLLERKEACSKCGDVRYSESYPLVSGEFGKVYDLKTQSGYQYISFVANGIPVDIENGFAISVLGDVEIGLDLLDSNLNMYYSSTNSMYISGGMLQSGKTYYIRVYAYSGNGVAYRLSIGGSTDEGGCKHEQTEHIWVLDEKAGSCEDGLLSLYVCKDCFEIMSANVNYRHETSDIQLDLSGACEQHSKYTLYACPCGDTLNWNIYGLQDMGNGTYCCQTCDLTVTQASTETKVGCEIHRSGSFVIVLGEKTVVSMTFNSVRDSHDTYGVATLVGGEGSSCEDGVRIEYFCRNCDESFGAYTTHSHEKIYESVELSSFGVCEDHWIHHGECACGKEQGVDYYVGNYYVESGVCCEECGLTVEVTDKTALDDNCLRSGEITYHFFVSEKNETTVEAGATVVEVGTYVVKVSRYEHECREEVEPVNPNGTCEDGVILYEVCRNCGIREELDTLEHHYEVYEEGIFENIGCGYHRYEMRYCACGYYFEMYVSDAYMGGEDKFTQSCENCNLSYRYATGTKQNGCYVDINKHATVTFEGKTLLEKNFTYTEARHNSYETVTLLNPGTTCNEGILVQRLCRNCDEILRSYEDKGHRSVHESVPVEGACEHHSIDLWTCACGEYADVDYYINDYSEENQACEECGLSVEVFDNTVTDESCNRVGTVEYIFRLGSEEILRVEEQIEESVHELVEEYILMNPDGTCKDGVMIDRYCKNCGESYETETVYYHEEFYSDVDFSAYEDVCGHHYLNVYSCACGYYSGCDMDYELRKTAKPADENATRFACEACGLELYRYNETVVENCQRRGANVYVVFVNGKQIGDPIEQRINEEFHNEIEEIILNEGSVSCEDGATYRQYCLDCGNVVNEYEVNYHQTYRVQEMDLSAYPCNDWGIHQVYIYQCACGLDSGVSYNGFDYTDSNSNGMMDEEDAYICYADCGLQLFISEALTEDGCHLFGNRIYTVMYEGELVDVLEEVVDRYNHKELVENVTLVEGAVSCEDGVWLESNCLSCGMTVENRQLHDHYAVNKELDFSSCDGVCDHHYAWVSKCACGEWCDYDYNLYGEVTEGANGEKIQCSYCDLALWITDETEVVDCRRSGVIKYSFTYNGVEVASFEQRVDESAHNYQNRYTLLEGNTSCEQGVLYEYSCTQCGQVNDSYTEYNHKTYLAGEILTGAACGSTLEEHRCACGAELFYELNSKCDFEEVWVGSDAVEGASEGTLYKCAVSNCGYHIFREYAFEYVAEDCLEKEYYIWHLGYDEATGESDQALAETPRYESERHTEISDHLDPVTDAATGITTYQNGYHCQYCASKYLEIWKEQDGRTIYSERTETNKNGQTNQWIDEYTYDDLGRELSRKETHTNYEGRQSVALYTYAYDGDYRIEETYEYINYDGSKERRINRWMYKNGYEYTTYSYESKTYEDGSEWWTETVYEYTFDGVCQVKITHTDSNGKGSENIREACKQTYYIAQQPTCTQYGLEVYGCPVCGSESDDGYELEPYGHNWCYELVGEADVANALCYRCSRCGQRSYTDANGDFIFEDLSEKNADGSIDTYVVGYWDRAWGEYVIHIALVLHTPNENGDNLVDLLNVKVTNDGKSKVSFSRADVLAAAAAAGYTDPEAFDIRLVFVPYGSGELDYGITFTEDGVSNNDGMPEESKPETCEHIYTSADGVVYDYCLNCGEKKDEAEDCVHQFEIINHAPTCKEGGYDEFRCVICKYSYTDNYTDSVEHSFTEEGFCTMCGTSNGEFEGGCKHENAETERSESTCTTNGYEIVFCYDCWTEISRIEIPATGHILTESGMCAVCGENVNGSEECKHVYTTADGMISDSCVICGAKKNETEGGCKHENVKTERIEPTCTTDGYNYITCADCNAEVDRIVIVATGHILTESGKCAVCGEPLKDIEACNHKYEVISHESTCKEFGYDEYICVLCKDCYTVEKTELAEHSFTEEGFCSVCGATADGSEGGDENGNPEDTSDKKYDESGNCIYEKTTEILSDGSTVVNIVERKYKNNILVQENHRGTGSNGDEWGTIREWLCIEVVRDGYVEYLTFESYRYDYKITQDGNFWYKCEYQYDFSGPCTYTVHYSDFSGENDYTEGPFECCYIAYVHVQDATCTEDGISKDMCLFCEKTYQEYIEAPLGHNWVDITDETGNVICRCESCGLESTRVEDGGNETDDTWGDIVLMG